mgnify:CR=1 FL=1
MQPLVACLAVAGSCLLMASCSSTRLEDSIVSPGIVYSTHVAMVRKCSFVEEKITAKFVPGILSVLAAGVIAQGVNNVGAALAEAGTPGKWEILASRNFDASTTDFPRCIQIVRGRFFTNPLAADLYLSESKNEREVSWIADSDEIARDNLTRAGYKNMIENGLWLASEPDFMFEGLIRPSKDNAALTIEPAHVSFERPVGKRVFRADADRQIAIFGAIHSPNQQPTLSTNPGFSLVLGRMSPGERRPYRVTQDGPIRANNGEEVLSSPFETGWFSLAPGETASPYTASILITETQGANAFFAFLGAVLQDPTTKTGVTEALKDALIPSERRAAELSERQAESENNVNFTKALGEALSNLQACQSAKDEEVLSKASLAKQNMISANFAAAKARADAPFSSGKINGIDLRKPASDLRAACKDAAEHS